MKLEKHFVSFLSPGTFVEEQTKMEIDSWDIEKATEMAKEIKERHGAKPYGFMFSTRSREDNELDSKETAHSGIYYLGGTIETLEEVKARATDVDRILISNMECNSIEKIITNCNSYKVTKPFRPQDTLLNVTL